MWGRDPGGRSERGPSESVPRKPATEPTGPTHWYPRVARPFRAHFGRLGGSGRPRGASGSRGPEDDEGAPAGVVRVRERGRRGSGASPPRAPRHSSVRLWNSSASCRSGPRAWPGGSTARRRPSRSRRGLPKATNRRAVERRRVMPNRGLRPLLGRNCAEFKRTRGRGPAGREVRRPGRDGGGKDAGASRGPAPGQRPAQDAHG